MTPEQRIAQHERTIEFIKQDIEWLRQSGFRMGPGTRMPESNTDQLIERQEENIAMYQGFIHALKAK